MVANTVKTAFLMFRPTKGAKEEFKVFVGGTTIKESTSERILGVQVQRTLEWDDHIAKTMSKVNLGLATLRQVQGML